MEKEGFQSPSYLIISSALGPSVQMTQVRRQEPFRLQPCPSAPSLRPSQALEFLLSQPHMVSQNILFPNDAAKLQRSLELIKYIGLYTVTQG